MMSAFRNLRTQVLRQWRKFVDVGIEQIVTAIAKKLGELLIGVVATLILGFVVAIVVARFSTPWQTRAIAVLTWFNVPSFLLPDDPERYSSRYSMGPQGFAEATPVFVEASREGTPPVQYDARALKRVFVCHAWQGKGASNFEILVSFVRAHPACFKMTDRQGGGVVVEPLADVSHAGDILLDADGVVVGFACECRDRLDSIRSELINKLR